ncbi:hypothetical protein COY95_04680, partial [Candidatus Woesearchaeota archaeon CG_4_10_14_0_8_um_filter_47_5]
EDVSKGEPVRKIMALSSVQNIARSIRAYSSQTSFPASGAIDGFIEDSTGKAWASDDASPWITLGFNQSNVNDSYYVTQLRFYNRPNAGFAQTKLIFSDGSTRTFTLANTGSKQTINITPTKKVRWVNITSITYYGSNAGFMEVEVYGSKRGVQEYVNNESVTGPYKRFNITVFYPNESMVPTTSSQKFYNVTIEETINDTNFSASLISLRVFVNNDWQAVNITKRCAKGFLESETNYSSVLINGKTWYGCYNDTNENNKKDYFKVKVPELIHYRFRVDSFASINILDEQNMPQIKTYDTNETVRVRVTELFGNPSITHINLTFTFADATTKIRGMTSGIGGSSDVWEYNYTLLGTDAHGFFNITASAYDGNWTLLTNKLLTGLRHTPKNITTLLDRTGMLWTRTNMLYNNNRDTSVYITGRGSNNSITLYIPDAGFVREARFDVRGSNYSNSYPTNVTLNIGGGAVEWSHSGMLKGINSTGNVNASLNTILSGICTSIENGYCKIRVNMSSATTGKITLENVRLRYYVNESTVFNRTAWWRNTTSLVIDASIDQIVQYQKKGTIHQNVIIHGFVIDNSSTQCRLNETLRTVKTIDNLKYCALLVPESMNMSGAGTLKPYSVWEDVSKGEPVRKIMALVGVTNYGLASNGGTVSSFSSETSYAANNANDGIIDDTSGGAWASNDAHPWIVLLLNDSYYVTRIKVANRPGAGFGQTKLVFSDGSTRTVTLTNTSGTGTGALQTINISPTKKVSWVNITSITTYGANAGFMEVEVYGSKTVTQTYINNGSTKYSYLYFNVTGLLPSETILNSSNQKKFSNVTADIRFNAANFTLGLETLYVYYGSSWVSLNTSKRCTKALGQTESNYSSKTINASVWYACFNDTSGDGIKDYFKVKIPVLRNYRFKVESLSSINILDEQNYPIIKAYDIGELVRVRVQASAGASAIAHMNITLSLANDTSKTFEMTGIGSSGSLWEYNY